MLRCACVLVISWAACAVGQEIPTRQIEESQEPRTIELAPDPGQDQRISDRLAAIFGAVGGLGNIEVDTEAGVVRLSGRVETPRLRATAEDIATALEGVVAVENEIESAAAVDTRVQGVLSQLRVRAAEWLQVLPLWLIAVTLVVAAWHFGAWLGTIAVRALRQARNPFAGELVRQAVRLAALVAAVLIALLLVDAGPLIGSVIGGLGLIGLAVGFAVRDTIENYFASILLSLRQPFRPNELVSIDGREGRVLRLNSRATLLMDPDGNHVRIPNALVYKATIINYDINPFRRFSFSAAVDPGAPLAEVLRVAESALIDTPGVVSDPPPTAIVESFGDWATNITCHAWVDQREVDLLKTRSAALVALQAALERAGVDMPLPSYSIAMQPTEGAASGGIGAQKPAPRRLDAEKIDVRRKDPTKPFRERDEGENLLAPGGRGE